MKTEEQEQTEVCGETKKIQLAPHTEAAVMCGADPSIPHEWHAAWQTINANTRVLYQWK